MYSDDTTLSTIIHYPSADAVSFSKLNLELNEVSNWLKINKLSLKGKKSEVMLFHQSKKQGL